MDELAGKLVAEETTIQEIAADRKYYSYYLKPTQQCWEVWLGNMRYRFQRKKEQRNWCGKNGMA